MRIEVLVENQDPLIFPLNKPKLIIGSHESCDVVLKTFGISRRHVEVISENDQYFIVDQESLNGTYINDQKIAPGKRVEFTSFFPVRLGDNVLVTLISDAEAEVIAASESLDDILKKVSSDTHLSDEDKTDTTRQISVSTLYNVKTEKLVKKRETVIDKKKILAEKRAQALKKDKQRMGLTKAVVVLLGAGTIYYNFFREEPLPVKMDDPIAVVGQQVVVDPASVPAVPKILLVDKSELTKKERFPQFLAEIKCTSDLEKYACEIFPDTLKDGYGAYQVGTMLNIVVDGASSYEKARVLVQPRVQNEIDNLTPEQREVYEKKLAYAAMIYFINEQVPATLNYGLLGDSKITFILMIHKPDGTSVPVAAAFAAESLQKLKNVIEPRHFENAYKYGVSEIEFFKEYFTYYQ